MAKNHSVPSVHASVNTLSADAKIDTSAPGQPSYAPLCNTDNVPVGATLRSALKGLTIQESSSIPVTKDESLHLDRPSAHHTLKISKKLEEIKQRNLDVTLNTEKKIASPNTARNIQKTAAKKVNHPDSSPVFSQLVSANTCQETVRRTLQEQLISKAKEVRPSCRANKIDLPKVSDWYNPEEYICRMPQVSVYETKPQLVPYDANHYYKHNSVDDGINFLPEL